MKVSVIIPSYNHAPYIEEAVQSVLNQTHESIQLIIVDDGSTDGSPEILQRLAAQHPFQLVLKANEGICKTLNHAVSCASGDLIVLLASDDRMPMHRISEQVAYMTKYPDADVIAGAVQV